MGCYKLHNYTTLQIAHTSNMARSREGKSDAGLYKYKFQNKEWQDELGLNMYDFAARGYMPDIVRTTTLDPLAEKFYSFSPYSFLNNNPLAFVDPTGMSADGWITQVIDGTTSHTYDASVNTTEEATAAGYSNVQQVSQSLSVSNSSHGYSYNLNADGSVTNASGGNIQFDKPITAENGMTVGGAFETQGGTKMYTSNLGEGGFNNLPKATGAITEDNTIANIFIGNALFKPIFGALFGTAAATTSPELTAVGRWMSQTEYSTMSATGRMVEGAGGQTFVTTGGASSFSAAARGSVYAEFQVSTNSLLQGGQANWFKTLGPSAGNAMQSALTKQGGQILPTIQNLSPILKVK